MYNRRQRTTPTWGRMPGSAPVREKGVMPQKRATLCIKLSGNGTFSGKILAMAL